MGGASGRCTLVDHGNLAEKFLEVFWLDLALLRGKSGQKSVSLGTGRFREVNNLKAKITDPGAELCLPIFRVSTAGHPKSHILGQS